LTCNRWVNHGCPCQDRLGRVQVVARANTCTSREHVLGKFLADACEVVGKAETVPTTLQSWFQLRLPPRTGGGPNPVEAPVVEGGLHHGGVARRLQW